MKPIKLKERRHGERGSFEYRFRAWLVDDAVLADGTKELLSWKSQKKRHEHRMIQCMPETSHLREQ